MNVKEPAKESQTAPLAELIAEAERLQWTARHVDAFSLLDKALDLAVKDVERYDVAEALLRGSNCSQGWDLYDLHPSRPVDRLPGVQRWSGESCPVLVIMADQGFGDAIQSLRFVPHVAGRADSIVVALHEELYDVMSSSPLLAGCRVMTKAEARGHSWPADARWERMMSLPAKIAAPELGPAAPYLLPVPNAGPVLQRTSEETLTVGVAWRTTTRRIGPNRSLPMRLMCRLTELDGVRVVPLHRNRDMRGVLPGAEIVEINNFRDTAAVTAQCDVVVTADTVTAHLAPALGTPTFACLLHRPDWRWGTPINPTGWYVRQETVWQDERLTWASVIGEIADRLRNRTLPHGGRP